MWMRTMRPSLLQRSHGPSETEDKGQKENKTQKVIDYQKFPPFSLFHFSANQAQSQSKK
jgi:hypothetical protein